MKVRSGFVSNSSTSSFLIYGAYLDTSKLEELLGINQVEPSDSADSDEEVDRVEKDVYDILEEKCGEFDLELTDGTYGYYIGASWDSVGDSETGKEFKQRVKDNLKKLFPKSTQAELDINTHSEAWHD